MDINKIRNGFRDDLRNNITDPLNRQATEGGQWIHNGDLSNVGKTPAVYIDLAPSPEQLDFVGGEQQGFLTFDIHAVVKEKDRGISPLDGGTTIVTDSDQLRDDLTQSIINRLKTARVAISGTQVVIFDRFVGTFSIPNGKIVNTLRYIAQSE